MEFCQKLLLKLVSVPFELRVTGICVVIEGDELTGDQTQLERIACRKGRRRRRSFAFFALGYNRFSKGQIEEFVKINPFHNTVRIKIRVINQIRRVERVRLFSRDKRHTRFRIPTKKRAGNKDIVQIVSTRVSRIPGISSAIVTGCELDAAKKILSEFKVGIEPEPKPPAIPLNMRILGAKSPIGQKHRIPLVPLIAEPEITAQFQLFNPVTHLDFRRRS